MKSSIRKVSILGSFFLCTMILFYSCKKDGSPTIPPGPSALSVYLTDDPCRYDALLIDLRYVEVKVDTTTHSDDDQFGDNDDDGDDDHQHHDAFGRWDTLSVSPGVYNIMQLRNGIDTLLAHGTITPGKIRKIRLTLGSNNSITDAGVNHPLLLSPGTNNYVYIKLHSEDEENEHAMNDAVWLDFDICSSVRLTGGQYYLKPFIRVFSMRQTGKVEGKVFPQAAAPFVTVSNANVIGYAIPEPSGEYLVRGLREGSYKIKFTGANGYQDTTIFNISVTRNGLTHVPSITLHH